MRSESLEYFLEIAECGSFTHAAKRLFVSQQGLSKSIKALEKDLGCRLFQRDGSQLKLSAAGRALVPYARVCLDDIDRLRVAMGFYEEISSPGRVAKKERITLYATAFIADSLFSLLDDDLRRAAMPNMRIIEHSPDQIIEALGQGDRPMLFATCLPADHVSGLASMPHVRFVPLFATEIVLVGSSQFIHPEKGAFSLDRIARMPLVYYNDPTLNHIIDEMFEGRELENVITHAASISRISRYIHQGKAVSFSDSLSCFLSEGDEGIAYAPIEDSSQFVVGFAYREDADLPERYLDYIDRFRRFFEQRCAAYLDAHPTPAL